MFSKLLSISIIGAEVGVREGGKVGGIVEGARVTPVGKSGENVGGNN